MTDQTYRRLFGAVFGAALGLTFGLMAQAANPLAMPGVTFHQPPLGMWGNIIGAALACGLAGLLAAWWSNAFISVLIAALVTGLGIELFGTLYGNPVSPDGIGPLILTIVILWLPMAGLMGALFTVLRWLINKQVEYRRDRAPFLRRVLWPGLALLIVGGIGATAIYPMEGQQRIREMNALLRAGLRSANPTELPAALAPIGDRFLEHVTRRYTLEWVKGDSLRIWRIPQPAGYQQWEFSIVAARLEDGWVLACLFVGRQETPRCQLYERDPTVKVAPSS